MVGISLSTKIGKACYIPIGHLKGNNLDEKNVLNNTKNLFLEDAKVLKKIGQNIKFDYISIYHHRGIDMNSLEDTMLMSYVLGCWEK